MSTHPGAAAHAHPGGHGHESGHTDHDDHDTDDGPPSSLRDYLIGFVLSVILTALPFGLVMAGVITDRTVAVMVLGGLAVAQILVHMVYFLHMNGTVQGGWTLLSTIFTIVFVAIAIAGTLWVMFNMNTHMMPSHLPEHLPSGLATPAPAHPAGHGN